MRRLIALLAAHILLCATVNAKVEITPERGVTVAGMAFVMATAAPEKKRVSDYKSLMVLDIEDDTAKITPADWLAE